MGSFLRARLISKYEMTQASEVAQSHVPSDFGRSPAAGAKGGRSPAAGISEEVPQRARKSKPRKQSPSARMTVGGSSSSSSDPWAAALCAIANASDKCRAKKSGTELEGASSSASGASTNNSSKRHGDNGAPPSSTVCGRTSNSCSAGPKQPSGRGVGGGHAKVPASPRQNGRRTTCGEAAATPAGAGESATGAAVSDASLPTASGGKRRGPEDDRAKVPAMKGRGCGPVAAPKGSDSVESFSSKTTHGMDSSNPLKSVLSADAALGTEELELLLEQLSLSTHSASGISGRRFSASGATRAAASSKPGRGSTAAQWSSAGAESCVPLSASPSSPGRVASAPDSKSEALAHEDPKSRPSTLEHASRHKRKATPPSPATPCVGLQRGDVGRTGWVATQKISDATEESCAAGATGGCTRQDEDTPDDPLAAAHGGVARPGSSSSKNGGVGGGDGPKSSKNGGAGGGHAPESSKKGFTGGDGPAAAATNLVVKGKPSARKLGDDCSANASSSRNEVLSWTGASGFWSSHRDSALRSTPIGAEEEAQETSFSGFRGGDADADDDASVCSACSKRAAEKDAARDRALASLLEKLKLDRGSVEQMSGAQVAEAEAAVRKELRRRTFERNKMGPACEEVFRRC